MKRLLEKCYMLGVQSCSDYKRSMQVLLSNQIILTLMAITLPYSVVFYVFGAKGLGLLILPLQALYGACLFLNAIQRYWASRILLQGSIGIPLYVYAASFGPSVGAQLGYFFLFIISYYLMQDAHRWIRWASLLFPVSLFLSLEISDYAFFYHIQLDSTYSLIIYIIVILTTFITFFLVINSYANLSNHFEKIVVALLGFNQITRREAEVISEIRLGRTNQEIAKNLFVEEGTVKTHIQNIYKKLNVKNRLALMAKLSI